MSGHVFVDESKQRDYLFVAAGVMPGDLAGARRAVRAHVMPGQRRLHLRKESDARRNAIVDAVASIGATRNHLQRRRPGHHMLVLEQDDPLLWWDQQHSSGSSARSDAAKTPVANTAALNTNSTWQYPTRSRGAGPRADTGATACSHRSGGAHDPSSAQLTDPSGRLPVTF